MGFSKSQSPSGTSLTYPFPLTYLILGTSVLCSSVSTGLLGYFVYYLNMDSMSVPWEFILLLVISSQTLLNHIFAIVLHQRSPSTSKFFNTSRLLVIHAFLLVLWIAGIAVLGRKIGPMVLSRSCGMTMWLTETGIMVCHIYKALFAFLVLSAAAVLALLALDIKVRFGNPQGGHVDTSYRNIDSGKKQGLGFNMLNRATTWGRQARGVVGGGVGYEAYSSQTNGTSTAVPATAQHRGSQGTGRGIASWKQSPDLSDMGDVGDSQRLVAESPEMGYTPYATPKLT